MTHRNIKRSQSSWTKTVLIALAATLVLSFAPFIYTGTFARYQADDYCSAQLLRTQGYWGAQWASYTGWSNRFSTMLATGLIDPLGVVGMRILPGLLIVGLLFSMFVLLRSVRSFFGIMVSGTILFCLAGAVTFFALYTTPNQFQSYYWRSGSVTYTLPLIMLLLLLASLLKRRGIPASWWQFGLIGLFSFFAAGFSETNAALQIALLALGLAGVIAYERRRRPAARSHSLWIAAFIGALTAAAVMLISPGNAVRMSQMPETPGFFRWLYLSLRLALGFGYNALTGTILPRGVSFILGFGLVFLFGWKEARTKRIFRSMLLVPLLVFLLAAAACAPSAYAQSAYPEGRALTGINFIFTAGLMIEGWLTGILVQSWLTRSLKTVDKIQLITATLGILSAGVYIIYGGLQVLKGSVYYQARAAAWDARAAQIEQLRQSGESSVVVIALDSTGGILELSNDPENWVNRCAAAYYQVDQIVAK